jgi:23S rRNA (cytosine1962-C5)-methyltransferase
MESAVVNARGAVRVRQGHPWVFRQDVVKGPAADAASGGPSIVTVRDARGKTLGLATWAASAKLALRILGRGPDLSRSDDVDVGDGGDDGGDGDDGHDGSAAALVALVRRRLDIALGRREGMGLHRDAYRVCHGESDRLPGLFVDRYADAAVMQTTSVAMDAARAPLAELIRERLGVRLVVARDDGSMRDFEGLARFAGVVAGAGPTQVVYRLGPNQLEADLLSDGKTGGFLDQADNQAEVAMRAPRGARCLDAFTYHGGFALALGRRGGDVLATDESSDAVARAAANARRNDLHNVEVRQANAFDLLRELEGAGDAFDVVVLDPPALAKRGQSRDAALLAADRAYKELILRGARLTAPGGLLVACSCSGRVTRAHWDELCADAVADSGRVAQVLARRGAAADHPELVGVPETGHLKCWLLRVL